MNNHDVMLEQSHDHFTARASWLCMYAVCVEI